MYDDVAEVEASFYIRVIKRGFDIVVGILGTVFVFFPIFIFIALFYQFGKNKGPIFFYQERMGKNYKKFKIIKFRSMVVNAEQVLEENTKLYQKYISNSYKLDPKEDPRLTGIGAFIRKFSIDEVPQFINILKGDMSFIGPRPILEKELDEYTEDQADLLLSVKPGATGWWQVSGRSDVHYPERCELELYYVRHASLALDVKILILTIVKVLGGNGAV